MSELENTGLRLHVMGLRRSGLELELYVKKEVTLETLETLGRKKGGEGGVLDISELRGEKTPAPPPREVVQEVQEKLHFYPEDRISEVKEKLALLLPEFPVYKQHLYLPGRGPLLYRILTEAPLNLEISRSFETSKEGRAQGRVFGLPMDYSLYQNRENYFVEALDWFTTLGEICSRWDTREFHLLSLDECLRGSETQLAQVSRTDAYQFQLFYYAFILKFFPLLSLEAFRVHVQTPEEMAAVYPDLFGNQPSKRARYLAEKESLDYKYSLLARKPKEFLRYVPEQASITSRRASSQKGEVMEVAIKSATAVVEKEVELRLENPLTHIRINMRNLFSELHAGTELPLIRARLALPEGNILLTKIKSASIVEDTPEDIQRIYEKVKYKLQLLYPNSLLLVIPVRAQELFLVLVIQENGKYQVRTSWGEEVLIGFLEMLDMITKHVNPLLLKINSLGRAVFEGISRLPEVRRNNVEFSGLHLSIFWKQALTSTRFQSLGKLLREETRTGILQTIPDLPPEQGVFEFQIVKGITGFNPLEFGGGPNLYDYLVNAKSKQRWFQLFGEGRRLRFIHRTTDVKVEVLELREEEFRYFYEYLISLLYRFEQLQAPEPEEEKPGERKTNLLKLLKARDPELYMFKRFGSDVVYSRICQREHQPIPYTEGELQNLSPAERKKAVKYWNFTTNSPLYYLCPNPKFPHLNFIVGQHPRDYCLPCCKKTPVLELKGVKSKKDFVYETCVQEHVYSEEENVGGSMRYIMNYGKLIDVGRISYLPDLITRYLLYNLEDKEIILEEQTPPVLEIKTEKGVGRYSLPLLLKLTKHSKVKDVPLEEMKEFLELPLREFGFNSDLNLKSVLAKPNSHPSEINRISNSDPALPLLVLRKEGGELQLLEGVYRLAKSVMVRDENVHVRTITPYQLEKSRVRCQRLEEEKKKGGSGSMRKPGYYLFGVPQNNMNVSNIGAGFSIATALNMSFPEFVEKCILFLKKGRQEYLRMLLNGELEFYFPSLQDLLEVMYALFVEEEMEFEPETGVRKFIGWNELFVELTELCFGKRVLILDDTSTDITGTSVRSTVENVDLVLPKRITKADEVIPTDEAPLSREYILLLRRRKRAKLLLGSDHIYYPIFVFIPQAFFRNMQIEKRVFSSRDEIIKLLRGILDQALRSREGKEELEAPFNLAVLVHFLRENPELALSVQRYYLNYQNLCYAVELALGGGKRKFIWPIHPTLLPNCIPMALRSTSFYRRALITLAFPELKKILQSYNNWVVKEAEKRGLFQVAPEKSFWKHWLNEKEKTVLTPYPLLKIERFLGLMETGEVIGFVARDTGFYFYFAPVSMEKKSYAHLVKESYRGYSLLSEQFPKLPTRYTVLYLRHDPDKVNCSLLAPGTEKEEEKKLQEKTNQALYKEYLYTMFTTEIISALDGERNQKVREEIRRVIEGANPRNLAEEGLKEFRKLAPEDAERLAGYLGQEENGKSGILKRIEEDVFSFDRITLRYWKELSDNYESSSQEVRREKKKKLLKEVEKLGREVFEFAPPSKISKLLGQQTEEFPNIIPCKVKPQPTCYKGRLLLSQEDFHTLSELFVSDLCNPLKREFLLSSVLLSNVRDYFRFPRAPGEEIYVKRVEEEF